MLRRLGALAVVLALGACATTASTVGFPSADADDDDLLSFAEFDQYFVDSGLFSEFDDNNDGMLNREEYNDSVHETYETDVYFNALDVDHNGMVSRSEFLDGWFKMFDMDRSNTLDSTEFANAIQSLETK